MEGQIPSVSSEVLGAFGVVVLVFILETKLKH